MPRANNIKISQGIWDAGLMQAVNVILGLGPQRILISEHEARASKHCTWAQKRSVKVILIRNDGWSLGVGLGLLPLAEDMWPDEWARVIFSTTQRTYAVSYKEWLKKGQQPGWVKAGKNRLEQLGNLTRRDGEWRTS